MNTQLMPLATVEALDTQYQVIDPVVRAEIRHLFASQEEYVVDVERYMVWLGVTHKQSVKAKLERDYVRDVDWTEVESFHGDTVKTGRPSKTVLMTRDTTKMMLQESASELGKLIRRYFVEVEKAFRAEMVRPKTLHEKLMDCILSVQEEAQAKLTEHDQRLAMLEKQSEQSRQLLLQAASFEAPTEAVPSLTTRTRISDLVRAYSLAVQASYQNAWSQLYIAFRNRTEIDLVRRAANATKKENKKVSAIEMAERLGELDRLYAVGYDLFGTLADQGRAEWLENPVMSETEVDFVPNWD